MNFLAHSLLGFNNAELIAGQFCGDFVRGSHLSHFPSGIERGIRLHRHLDVFTDSHPALLETKQSIEGLPRRFAGVVIDVLFDHFLARNWSRFSPLSLPDHADRVHDALDTHHEHLPASLQRFLGLLKRERILENNQDLQAIELTLSRLSRRSPRFSELAIQQPALAVMRDKLEQPFVSFYPDLHEAATQWLAQASLVNPTVPQDSTL